MAALRFDTLTIGRASTFTGTIYRAAGLIRQCWNRAGAGQGACSISEYRQMKVWIYVDTGKQVGDRDHLKVFDSQVGRAGLV